jgi:Gas vesicle protein G
LLIVDKLFVSGIKFVLGKVAAAVDAELNDDSRLREELLAAQMRLELGEMTQEEFAAFEADILARLREIRERQLGEAAQPTKTGELKVTGVEATVSFEKE